MFFLHTPIWDDVKLPIMVGSPEWWRCVYRKSYLVGIVLQWDIRNSIEKLGPLKRIQLSFTNRFKIFVLNSPLFVLVFNPCSRLRESLRWAPSSYVFGPSQQLLGEGPAPSFHRTRAQLQHGERRRSTGGLEMKWMKRRAKNGGYNW